MAVSLRQSCDACMKQCQWYNHYVIDKPW